MTFPTRIFVAGSETLVGQALLGHLRETGQGKPVGLPPHEPDLTCPRQVDHFFAQARPEVVVLAAGLSGGIQANQKFPADFMLHNMLVSINVLDAAFRNQVHKLLYLGSSCMYPRLAPQPMQPASLFTGPLETTNEAYATAKLAGLKLCQAFRRQHGALFIAGIPANSYGPLDDFHPETSHVIPALIRRMHEAKTRDEPSLTIWGSGRPRREFIFASDLAAACLFVLNHYDASEPINLGSGIEVSIAETAELIADVVGYRGRLRFDPTRPDGMPRKCLDCSPLLQRGWRPGTALRAGLEITYAWFLRHQLKEETPMFEPLYKSLYRIRRLEEEIAGIYPSDRIKSPVHLSIGQEAVSVGVCAALNTRDMVFGTYRSHALYLAKGGNLRQLMAELYGKVTGCARGKGGSMHLIDVAAGVMGTSAVVGTTIANAVGYAYALKVRRQDAIVASFFGDGATEEGVFAESLNFAALKRLPILFVCENNQYAIHTHQRNRQARLEICERARAHGLAAERVDNNDVLRLFERSQEAVSRLRAGHGPVFFEVMTYRWQEHVGPADDYHLGYRTEKEAQPWKDNDQVRRLARWADPEERSRIEAEVDKEIADAIHFAQTSPFPGPDELYQHVFKEEER